MIRKESPNYFALSFAFVVVLVKGAVLGWILGQNIFDPAFFTYFTYALVYAFYVVALFAVMSLRLLQFVYTFLLVPMAGQVLFVYVAIVVIVAEDDWVFTRGSILGGTSRSLGDIHTGDWLFHYLPAVVITLYILIHNHYIALAFHDFWRELRRNERIGYILYLYLLPLSILFFYMLVMPFATNYRVHMSTWTVTALTLGVSVLMQTLLILIFIFALVPSDEVRGKIASPTGRVAWNLSPEPSTSHDPRPYGSS